MMGPWTWLLKFCLDAKGFPTHIIKHNEHDEERIASMRAQDHDVDIDNCESGTLVIDDIVYHFVVDTYRYSNSVVTFQGVQGSCECNDRQPAYELVDGRIVSDRHPGLKWTHDGTSIDVDEMHRLWKARIAYPFRPVNDTDLWMPCIDADGNHAEFTDYNSNEVDVTGVLDFIYAHLCRLDFNE